MESPQNITFVTSCFNYNSPFSNENNEWSHFSALVNTGVYLCIFVPPTMYADSNFIEFCKGQTNIKVYNFAMEETYVYKAVQTVESKLGIVLNLPTRRNLEKDTREHILNMNSKIELTYMISLLNPWNTHLFAWIDFNLFKVFKNKHISV